MARLDSVFRILRLVAAVGAVVVISGATWVSVQPTVAHAAGCDFPFGHTSNLATGPQGVHPVDGTIWTKPGNTTCHDLNVHWVNATDYYSGWLERSDGSWFQCQDTSSGTSWVKINQGSYSRTNPPYLCTDVAAGTHMAIVQKSSTRRNIVIED